MPTRQIQTTTRLSPSSSTPVVQPPIGDVTAVSAAVPVPVTVDGQIVAKITITATAPILALFGSGDTLFAGVQCMLGFPSLLSDQGWQRPAGIAAATPFSFDLIVPYPAAPESWTVYLRARSEKYINPLVLSGIESTPDVVVAMVPLAAVSVPNVVLFSAGTSDGAGSYTALMYWDPVSKVVMLIDWGCLAPDDRTNWGGVQIWIQTPDGLGGFNYFPATGILGIEAFTDTGATGFVILATISVEPVNVPVPPQSWVFIACSAANDADKTLNRIGGHPTGPSITLATLAKTDFITGFTAAANYPPLESGDQVFDLSGSWTNIVPFRYKGVRIVLRGYAAADQTLADEFEGSTSFLTSRWPIPPAPVPVVIYATPIFGDGTVAAIIPGTTPSVALTIQRQMGVTGLEYAQAVTSFACGVPYYDLNGAGQQTLFIPVTWVRPVSTITASFSGVILKMIRAGVHYRLSDIEPTSPNLIEINNFPAGAAETTIVYALSVDKNNSPNNYLLGVTPAATVILPVPTRVPTGSGFLVTYAYNKLITGQTVLEITPAFVAPTSPQFAWFDFWGQREDGFWYPLGSPDQGGSAGMATVPNLPAIPFTWNFLLIPNDVNGKDRDGNSTSNPASPPSGSLSTTKLINPLKTASPLGQVTGWSVTAVYTAPDNDGAVHLLLTPFFTKPADPTWAYIQFWAYDGAWHQLGNPGTSGAVSVATIDQLPTAVFSWQFLAISINANNQDSDGSYTSNPASPPPGTPSAFVLSIGPPGLGPLGIERTSNITFDTSFNGGVNPSVTYPNRADGTSQVQIFAKIILPVGDTSWSGYDVITVGEDVATGLISTAFVPTINVRQSFHGTDAIFTIQIPDSLVRAAIFFLSFDRNGRKNTLNYTELGLGGILTPRKDIAFGSTSGLLDPRQYDPSTTTILSVVGSLLKLSTGSVENLNMLRSGTNRIVIIDTDILDLHGGKLVAGTVSTAKLDTVSISVGGGGGKTGVFNVFGSGGTNIGFIGVSGADEGGWFKTGGFGGTSFASAVVKASSSGVIINGASFNITSGAQTFSIDGSNGFYQVDTSALSSTKIFGGTVTVQQTSSGFKTVLNTAGVFCYNATATNLAYFGDVAGSGEFNLMNSSGAIKIDANCASSYGYLRLRNVAGNQSIELSGSGGVGDFLGGLKINSTTVIDNFRNGSFGAVSSSADVTVGGALLLNSAYSTVGSRTAGGAPSLPANPVGYMTIYIGGIAQYFPYYG